VECGQGQVLPVPRSPTRARASQARQPFRDDAPRQAATRSRSLSLSLSHPPARSLGLSDFLAPTIHPHDLHLSVPLPTPHASVVGGSQFRTRFGPFGPLARASDLGSPRQLESARGFLSADRTSPASDEPRDDAAARSLPHTLVSRVHPRCEHSHPSSSTCRCRVGAARALLLTLSDHTDTG
jgi:hypothetical protein